MTRHKLLAFLCFAFSTAANAEIVKIPEGTEVDLQFIEKLSSGTAVEGQRFNLEVDRTIKIDGKKVILAGAKAVGTVVNAKKRGFMGKAGELDILVNYVLVNDERLKLRASSGREGKGRVGATVVLTALFGPLGLLKRGKDIEVMPGTIITAYIDETSEIEIAGSDSGGG